MMRERRSCSPSDRAAPTPVGVSADEWARPPRGGRAHSVIVAVSVDR
ncbi:hypothetical protein GS506_27615 [Rhodococcus hoagii]|nr:hypothetical protein [Prescottella equi]